jgi:hypothetical protein
LRLRQAVNVTDSELRLMQAVAQSAVHFACSGAPHLCSAMPVGGLTLEAPGHRRLG